MPLKQKSTAVISRSVKEAIDSYPGGLCFAAVSGEPILVNRQMNVLVSAILGVTVLEANYTWDELSRFSGGNGCVRLDQPQLENVQQEDGASLFFQLPAGEIWHFRRQLLSDGDTGFIQIEASEITQLYHMSKELYQNNIRLYNLRERQEALLSDIAQINRESELLATKMRIHDDLGRCLVATKRVIGAQALSDAEYRELLNGWEEAIRDMTNIPLQSITKSPEEELRKVADLVGCKIELIGEQPAERRALLLLYHAIREALTNAVRHAGADRLTVTITQDEAHYHILIASNGKSSVTEIRESGGLGSLRKSLEQEGASLSYLFGESVTVVVDIPYRKGGRSV